MTTFTAAAPRRAWRRSRSAACRLLVPFVALLAGAVAPATAQLPPHADWRTISTRHFDVHFTPELEAIARRAAVVAESAWVRLAEELTPPRGRVQLVVADNVDFSNGAASTFPTNRIVVYARPPVDVASLRFYEDWTSLVVTHELVHIFHLDRARGIWRLGQYVFGRNPALMPNLYLPGWVKEGLAVYYETRLTTTGRLAGSQFPMYARAAAADGRLPALGDLSLANPSFLGGEVAYAYGALAFDHLARTRGEEGIGRFVEATSKQLIPVRLNWAANRAFGISMERAWREWRDSARRHAPDPRTPIPGWQSLTERGWYVASPRWLDDERLVYVANTGREITGAYVVDTSGHARRVGRRNALEPNVPLPDGGLLYAQPDFVDPFTVRSDLWVQRDGRERRLTRGARLSFPDARGDGTIVAVQGQPGSSRLVLVSPDGSRIVPLTVGSPSVQWAEPRWAPDGRRLVAVRWSGGGVTEIVVLDTAGAVLDVLARDRAVNKLPSWAPDGRSVVYVSDRDGSPQVWRAWLPDEGDAGGVRQERVSAAGTGVVHPELARDGERLAAVVFRADGWHLGVGAVAGGGAARLAAPDERRAAAASGTSRAAPQRGPMLAAEGRRIRTPEPGAGAELPVRPYRPWRQLLPSYWAPVAGEGPGGGLMIGGLTSGSDVVGRHAWSAQATVEPSSSLWEGRAGWRYGGFGQPYLDLGASQHWSRDRIVVERGDLGNLDERVRYGSLGLTAIRPRARTYGVLSLAADLESRRFFPRTPELDELLRDDLRGTRNTPGVRLSASWTNTQRPALSISPEDGITVGLALRNRWLLDVPGGTTRSAVATLAAYRSLPFPGATHHVLALRGALGVQDVRTTSPFEIGGVSGGSLELLPGLAVGGSPRTFFVRGWAPASLEGTRAAAGSLEWRAPLAVVGRGVPHLPAFVQQASVTGFVDAAAAWCPAADAGAPACVRARASREWLVGAGGELVVDLAPIYDVPYRVRVGAATPVRGTAPGGRAPGVYLTLGASF